MELPALNQPLALWWLAAVLPVLFWLAQPPRPRRVLVTAHRAQWLLAQAALRRRPVRFRALRWLLLSLAAVCAVGATAAPELARGGGPARLLVLLDGSASMGQRTGDTTAFDLAVARLRALFATVPDDVAVEVVEYGDGAFERWAGATARHLAGPRPPAGVLPAPLHELAGETLGAAGGPGGDLAVLVVTDAQAGADFPDGVAVWRFGGGAANAAISAVALADAWPAPALRCTATVANFADLPLAGKLTVSGAVRAEVTVPVAAAPGATVQVDVEVQRAVAGGELRLALVANADHLPADDLWTAALAPLPAPRIALAAPPEAVFVSAAAHALAEAFGAEVVPATAGDRAGFLVAEGGTVDVAPGSVPMVAFGTALRTAGAAGSAGTAGAEWPAPLVVDWARDGIGAGLDLSELVVERARRDALPPGEPLLIGGLPDGGTAPLAVLVRGAAAASLHFAFRLQDSNLGLLPALPQILVRAYRLGFAPPATRPAAPALPAAESDLRAPAAAERPLPPFGTPRRDLAPWCLLLVVVLLAIRAAVR